MKPDQQSNFMPLMELKYFLCHTFGEKSVTLNLGLHRNFSWIFITADVKNPIIGAHFLHHFGLTVNLHAQCLKDDNTNISVKGVVKFITNSVTLIHYKIKSSSPNTK